MTNFIEFDPDKLEKKYWEIEKAEQTADAFTCSCGCPKYPDDDYCAGDFCAMS